MSVQQGLPFRVDATARQRELQTSVSRAVTAMARSVASKGARYPAEIAAQEFGDDRAAREIATKGAVSPTTTSTASSVAAKHIETVSAILEPGSARGNVIARAPNISPDDSYGVIIPSATAAADDVFVGEGLPAKVKSYSFSAGVTLLPKKTAFITVLTREIAEHSDAPVLIRDLMSRNFGLSLDSVMFGANAATATAPAGLLFGLSTVGATANGGLAALIGDLGKLASACASLGGRIGDLIYIGGPSAAMKVASYLPQFKYPVFSSSVLPDTTLVALSPSCLAVVGAREAPLIDVSKQAAFNEASHPYPPSGNRRIVADSWLFTHGVIPGQSHTEALGISSLGIDEAHPLGLAMAGELQWSIMSDWTYR